jgi:hypothetical protein
MTDENGGDEPVLDVHPPHEPVHGWRDILIHLATITVGLFIALSLEGCVEWRHHRHLVREARENIRTEMEDNQKELRSAIQHIHEEQAQVNHDLEALKTLRSNSNAHGLSVTLRFQSSTMQNASWNTARETGAFGFMGYPEVKRYAEVYDQQTEFAKQTDRVTFAYTNSFSVLGTFGLDEKEAPATKKRDIDDAIQKVLAVQSELLVYDSAATELDKMYEKTLKQLYRKEDPEPKF